MHHVVTSTKSCSPSASPRGTRTVPGGRSRAIRARSERDVPFELTVTRVARGDPPRAGVGARQLDLAVRPLELELGRALDRGPGEERPVGQEPQPARRAAPSLVGGFGTGCTASGRVGRVDCSPISAKVMPP